MSSPDDKDVLIWEAATGKVVKTLAGHTRSIWTARYSTDGKKLITGSADGTAIIWDTETGKRIALIDQQSRFSEWEDGVTSAMFTPDGHNVAIFIEDGKWIKIFNASSGKLKKSLESTSGVLSFSPDGKLLLTALALWDLTSGRIVYSLAGCSKQVSPKFSPDGKVIATISGPFRNTESTVKFWTTTNGKYAGKIDHPFPGKFNKDIETRHLYAQFSDDSRWVLTECSLSPSDLSFSSKYELLKIWDASKGKLVKTIDGYSVSISAQFSPDSKFVAVSDVAGSVDLYNISPPKLVNSLNLKGWTAIDFSPDSQWMVTKAEESVSIWKTGTFEKIMTIDFKFAWPVPCAFSKDVKLFAVAGGDAIIRIIETGSWDLLKSLKGHADDINYLEFSPDGNSILAGSKDGTIGIWDVSSGILISTLRGHSKQIMYAGYSPDMKWVITSSYDKTIIIWDPQTGKNLQTIHGRRLEGIDWPANRLLTSNGSEVSLYTLLDDKPLLSFVIVGENDWVVTHWSGLFDASRGAMKLLYFVDNQGIIEFDKLKEKYYEPGLWEKAISGKSLRLPGN
jgi:WD40 repeat protein